MFDPQSPHYQPPLRPAAIDDLAFDSLDSRACRLIWSAPERLVAYRLYSGPADWDGNNPDSATAYRGDLPGVRRPGDRQHAWIALTSGETRAWALFGISDEDLLSPSSNIVVIEAPLYDNPARVTVAARSIYIADWTLSRLMLDVSAEIIDLDTTVAAWLEWDTINLGSLEYSGNSTWSRQFREFNLPVDLEMIIGHPLYIGHTDRAGFTAAGAPFRLTRIISVSPAVKNPANDTLVDVRPRLEWEEYSAGFRFTYTVRIIHVPESFVDRLVYERDGIGSDSTGHTVETALTDAPRFLYWTISVIDDFGNEARSTEARFNVRPDG